MNDLLDLRTDADVDALMTRLRARIATPPADQAALPPAPASPIAGDALIDLAAAHEVLTASLARAVELMVETVEDFAADADTPRDSPSRTRRQPVVRTTRRSARR